MLKGLKISCIDAADECLERHSSRIAFIHLTQWKNCPLFKLATEHCKKKWSHFDLKS